MRGRLAPSTPKEGELKRADRRCDVRSTVQWYVVTARGTWVQIRVLVVVSVTVLVTNPQEIRQGSVFKMF